MEKLLLTGSIRTVSNNFICVSSSINCLWHNTVIRHSVSPSLAGDGRWRLRDVDDFVRSSAGSCTAPSAGGGTGARLSRLGGRMYGGSMLDGPSTPGHAIAGGVQHAAPAHSWAMADALKYEHDIIWNNHIFILKHLRIYTWAKLGWLCV